MHINDLLNCLSLASSRMFADDPSISYEANTLVDLENVINSQLKKLSCWLKANKLSLNLAKTEFMVIGSCQRLHTQNNDQINIKTDGKKINKVDEVKSLGLIIDKHLSWLRHTDSKSKKISSAFGTLKRTTPFVPMTTTIQIYQAYIQPHFDYCSSVWDGLSATLSDKLQKQKKSSC